MSSIFTKRPQVAIALACLLLAPLAIAYQDQPPYKIGNGVSAPVPTYKPAPEYTAEAKDAKIQGSVILSVVIDPFGIPTDILVTKSLDPGLDTKAIEAVKEWRFRPGMKDEKPVPVQATLEITFKLL